MRTLSNVRHNVSLGKPVAGVPSSTTNVIIASSSLGIPLWVQLMSNKAIWVYIYLRNEQEMTTKNYKPIDSENIFPWEVFSLKKNPLAKISTLTWFIPSQEICMT